MRLRRFVPFVALVSALALAVPATAVTYNPAVGGSVTKAEILTALGWDEAMLEAHAAQLSFSVASYRKAKQDCTKTTPGHTFTVAMNRWQEGVAAVTATTLRSTGLTPHLVTGFTLGRPGTYTWQTRNPICPSAPSGFTPKGTIYYTGVLYSELRVTYLGVPHVLYAWSA